MWKIKQFNAVTGNKIQKLLGFIPERDTQNSIEGAKVKRRGCQLTPGVTGEIAHYTPSSWGGVGLVTYLLTFFLMGPISGGSGGICALTPPVDILRGRYPGVYTRGGSLPNTIYTRIVSEPAMMRNALPRLQILPQCN